MRSICAVFKREVKAYFTLPIAYVMMGGLLFIVGLLYWMSFHWFLGVSFEAMRNPMAASFSSDSMSAIGAFPFDARGVESSSANPGFDLVGALRDRGREVLVAARRDQHVVLDPHAAQALDIDTWLHGRDQIGRASCRERV